MGALEQALKIAVRIEAHDRAAAKVADEQLITMTAEGFGREGQAPGRINLAQPPACARTGGETVKASGGWVQHIDQAIARARNVIFLVGVLFGKRDEDHA